MKVVEIDNANITTETNSYMDNITIDDLLDEWNRKELADIFKGNLINFLIM